MADQDGISGDENEGRAGGNPAMRAEQRLLQFINEARVPEDLTVLAHDVQVVGEVGLLDADGHDLHSDERRGICLIEADGPSQTIYTGGDFETYFKMTSGHTDEILRHEC